ncbi:MAG: Rab proteins geranylgeranyltransferase component A [Tremellales sp. Tagirdzhanova-0007]|nr:MAG: Rab proteins geranylgeranyltransferase component A [Tremellales sp. Tagirdzhanova-0007]
MELEADTYDVVVIGTGLAESIAAAALAKAGKSVLHLDPNDYYGARQASLTLDELVQWSDSHSSPLASISTTDDHVQRIQYTLASTSPLNETLQADRRRYALSLFPSILPSRGPLISTLIASEVSRYISFRLLDSISVWDPSTSGVRRVPGSKEEIFKDKSVGLIEKRKLMKFLMFAAGVFEDDPTLVGKEGLPLPDFLQGEFNLSSDLTQAVTYAIAHASAPTDPTLPALIRTRRYLRSVGRYGAGAFLIGQYGGAGEVAQGFCRACAVHGGTCILGSNASIKSIKVDDEAKRLITTPDHLPSSLLLRGEEDRRATTAYCIAIVSSLPQVLQRDLPDGVDQENGEETIDTAVILFPPEEGVQLVRALIHGETTGSCPCGQFILYLSTSIPSPSPSVNPIAILRPYLRRLSSEPLFEAYYLEHRPTARQASTASAVTVIDPYHGNEMLTEGLDWEAEQGEKAFYAVMGESEAASNQGGIGFFEKGTQEGESLEDDSEL